MKAEFFAHVINGQIKMIACGHPEQELTRSQLPLSKAEFELLRVLFLHTESLDNAYKLLGNLLKRTKALTIKKRSKK